MITPRLPSSKKWTSVPSELCTQVREVFAENFMDAAKTGQFLVNGRIYAHEILLQVGFLPKGRLRQVNFEVSIDFDVKKQNALELIHFSVDCAASLFQEYFSQDESLDSFPLLWKSYNFETRKAFVQVSTVNTALESEADRLLGTAKNDLVVDDGIDTDDLTNDLTDEAAHDSVAEVVDNPADKKVH